MKKLTGEPLKIECCGAKNNCPRALDNFDTLQKIIIDVVDASRFIPQRKELLQNKIKPHQVFKITLAGCPNSCSQPQIKDFGVIKNVFPEIKAAMCTLCSKCVRACKEKALTVGSKSVHLDEQKCIGCGDCLRVCPVNALRKGKEQWRVLAGGKLGRHPRLAVELAQVKTAEEVGEYLEKALEKVLAAPDCNLRLADLL